MSEIRTCKKCGFILGTRPNLKEFDGVCSACINEDKKEEIDFKGRQKWLTQYIKDNKTSPEYDCVVAVSGGKDSHMIVKRLIENHGVKNPLLVSVYDEFTHSQAGVYNIDNMANEYNLDHIKFRCQPKSFCEHTRSDFETYLHPLIWIEKKIYEIPLDIAKRYGIKLVFYGENSAFEYGAAEELDIFHPASTDNLKVIFLGAIYPFSISDSLEQAQAIGFRDLDYYNEWQRQGCIENYMQIDSLGYIVHTWCKFIKFGFARTTDIACRYVREGKLTKEQAELLIKERDYICDPAAKRDFCKTLNITAEHFDEVVDKFANRDLLVKDINGVWKRKDLI